MGAIAGGTLGVLVLVTAIATLVVVCVALFFRHRINTSGYCMFACTNIYLECTALRNLHV